MSEEHAAYLYAWTNNENITFRRAKVQKKKGKIEKKKTNLLNGNFMSLAPSNSDPRVKVVDLGGA